MLFRSIVPINILIALVFVIFVQSEQTNSVSSHRSKAKIPSIMDDEASQWLSTRHAPRRFHQQHLNQPSSDFEQSLKQLQSLNDNGNRQFDTQSFEGVSMEVIFEMVYKQQTNAVAG